MLRNRQLLAAAPRGGGLLAALRCVDRRTVSDWRAVAEVMAVLDERGSGYPDLKHFQPSHAKELAVAFRGRYGPARRWDEGLKEKIVGWVDRCEEEGLTVAQFRECLRPWNLDPQSRPPPPPPAPRPRNLLDREAVQALEADELEGLTAAELLDRLHGLAKEMASLERRFSDLADAAEGPDGASAEQHDLAERWDDLEELVRRVFLALVLREAGVDGRPPAEAPGQGAARRAPGAPGAQRD
jgi:hypothetical protein